MNDAPSQKLYSVIVLCHNQLETTKRCLDLLFQTDLSKAQIIVVDNCSTDATWEYLWETRHQVDVIYRNNKNEGVGAGYNVGFQFVHAPFFVTLNNDIEVYESEWLFQMASKFGEDPRIALVGLEGTACWLDGFGLGHPRADAPADYVEASCMMGQTEIVKENGPLFDPAYRFGYCEDTDLSLRLRKKGYKIAHVPLNVKHVRSKTADSVREEIDIDGFHTFNHMVLQKRWYGYLQTKSFGEEVAIRRTRAMGDVLWTTPVLRQMKRENPHLKIHFYTDYPEILRGNPYVDTVGPCNESFDECERKIDLDLAYEMKPYQHTVLSYAEACGVKLYPEDWWPDVFLNEEEQIYGDDFVDELFEAERYAAIHLGPSEVVGRTLAIPLVQAIEDHLRERRWSIFRVQIGDGYSFHKLAAIIGRCKLFVGADSMPMHLAQAARIPTVGIYGSISPLNWQIPNVPYIKAVTAEPMKVGCLGCHREYAPPMTGPLCIRHGENINRCMKMIDPEDVFRAIEEVLEAAR